MAEGSLAKGESIINILDKVKTRIEPASSPSPKVFGFPTEFIVKSKSPEKAQPSIAPPAPDVRTRQLSKQIGLRMQRIQKNLKSSIQPLQLFPTSTTPSFETKAVRVPTEEKRSPCCRRKQAADCGGHEICSERRGQGLRQQVNCQPPKQAEGPKYSEGYRPVPSTEVYNPTYNYLQEFANHSEGTAKYTEGYGQHKQFKGYSQTARYAYNEAPVQHAVRVVECSPRETLARHAEYVQATRQLVPRHSEYLQAARELSPRQAQYVRVVRQQVPRLVEYVQPKQHNRFAEHRPKFVEYSQAQKHGYGQVPRYRVANPNLQNCRCHHEASPAPQLYVRPQNCLYRQRSYNELLQEKSMQREDRRQSKERRRVSVERSQEKRQMGIVRSPYFVTRLY